MTFVCQRCGDCCSSMGVIISIQEQTGSCTFRIGFTDGEERVVCVDPDKRELFLTGQQDEKRTLSCPFLRDRGSRERICTVHASRPDLCRHYLCSRILVLGPGGTKAGRVLQGTRSFSTEDGSLRALWNRAIQDIRIPDEDAWGKYVEEVFSRAGYRVIR